MSTANKIFIAIVVLNLAVLNYLVFNSQIQTTTPSIDSPTPTPASLACPNSCQEIIQEKLGSLPTPQVIYPSPSSQTIPLAIPLPQKSTIYVPISGPSETASNTWQNLAETVFSFNPSDYSKLKNAYFEANFRLQNGNGQAYLRLFDQTAGIEVWGSEISTTSQSFTAITSPKLTLRPGNHTYIVQAKSLTADTVIYSAGRIKINLEN